MLKKYYKLCVMGNPIEHSKSPWIHYQFADQLNIAIDYIRVKPALDGFHIAISEFKRDNGYGFNVTLPFKQQAYHAATVKTERAEIAKAVNTVIVKPDGSLWGDNTDGLGFINDITNNIGYSLANKSILVMGAGGAVRGILEPLLSQSPGHVNIVNRSKEHAQRLEAEFSKYGDISSSNIEDLKNQKYDVIIDGTAFNSDLFFPVSLILSGNSLCYDLKYSNNPTPFMRWAESRKSSLIYDGIGMLIEQAAEAFYLWTGLRPSTTPVIELARKMFYLPSDDVRLI